MRKVLLNIGWLTVFAIEVSGEVLPIRAGSLLAMAASAMGVQSRTFYVDAARGDDAQDGLTPETAWCSLARINRAVLAPGDRVLFCRGQTWRGQLRPQSGDANGVICYGAFGEGAKPVLLGSVAANRAEDWRLVRKGLWETVPSQFESADDPVSPPPNRPTSQAGGEVLDTLKPQRVSLLSVDVGNIIFDHGKSTGVKKWSEAELGREGDYLYDSHSQQVKLRSDANPATCHRSIELALRRHIIDQGGRGYVSYENLDLRNGAAHGIGGGSPHHITIRGCDLSFIGGGHQLTRADGKPVRFGNGIEFWSDAHDCLVEDCRIWEIYDAALTNQGDGTNVQENIIYRRNVIWNSEYSFEYWNRGPASQTRNILFEHNTCVDAGCGWGHSQRPDPNGRHLMFYDNTATTTNFVIHHNIFCNATDSLLRLHGRDWTAALTMDNNGWFQSRGVWVLWGSDRIDNESFSTFMHPRGFDLHSVLAAPNFVNASQHDYRLTSESPLRKLAEQGQPVGALP